MSIKALETHLAPLAPFLTMDGVTEICINKPKEVFVEQKGIFTRYEILELEYHFLETLAALIAEFNHKAYPAALISGSLLNGERVQIVTHPACEKGNIIFSIRRHQSQGISLEEYQAKGSFLNFQQQSDLHKIQNQELIKLFQQKDIENFLRLAIQLKKNILISGGTGTGKTTFLNACLKIIPSTERLITVEDTREVSVDHENAIHLLFNENQKDLSALNIFKACLRLRPDRIFLSELRGHEVWPYLRAANSGHPGTLTTVHANNPNAAFQQLVFMMQQAGSTSSEEQLRDYIKAIINIVIQLKRDTSPDRFMYVSDVYFDAVHSDKFNLI